MLANHKNHCSIFLLVKSSSYVFEHCAFHGIALLGKRWIGEQQNCTLASWQVSINDKTKLQLGIWPSTFRVLDFSQVSFVSNGFFQLSSPVWFDISLRRLFFAFYPMSHVENNSLNHSSLLTYFKRGKIIVKCFFFSRTFDPKVQVTFCLYVASFESLKIIRRIKCRLSDYTNWQEQLKTKVSNLHKNMKKYHHSKWKIFLFCPTLGQYIQRAWLLMNWN